MAKIRTFDISEEIKKLIDGQANIVLEKKEKALDKASEYMVQQLENATPIVWVKGQAFCPQNIQCK